MTQDEMKRQKADTLLAYQETQQELEHLKLKAFTLAEDLMTFARWLRDDPENKICRPDQAHHGHNVEITPPKYFALFEPTQYFMLAEEIREKKKKLLDLTQLKGKLGLR